MKLTLLQIAMAFSVNDTINMSMYGSILPQNVMTQLPSSLALSAQGQVDHLQGFPHGSTTHLHIPTIPQMSSAVAGPSYLVVPTTSDVPPPPTSLTTVGTTSTVVNAKSGTKEEPKIQKNPEILKKMKKLRDERKYCDLWIDVKGVRFQAHRNILAAWSPYFDSQLISEEPYMKDLMIVSYDNYEVFSDLLEFLYTGVIAPRETNFLQLLHLAVSFQIDLLKSYCEEFLRCNLHLGNFISTYFLSRKYKLDSLEKYIVSFLQVNLSDMVKQSEFISLPASRFNAFLSSGFMNQIKPEIKLFLIISWVGYEVSERERFLVVLLGHIDWSAVATDFLLEISRTENFFTSHESSLYLLLQTLHSSGISLGPYTELFPGLRQTYNHLLHDIMNTGIILPDDNEFIAVTVKALCTKNRKIDAIMCTELQGLVFEELTITPVDESAKKYMESQEHEAMMDDYDDTYNDMQNASYEEELDEQENAAQEDEEIEETQRLTRSGKKRSKRKSSVANQVLQQEDVGSEGKGKKRKGKNKQNAVKEETAETELPALDKFEENYDEMGEEEEEEEKYLREEDFLQDEEEEEEEDYLNASEEEEWLPEGKVKDTRRKLGRGRGRMKLMTVDLDNAIEATTDVTKDGKTMFLKGKHRGTKPVGKGRGHMKLPVTPHVPVDIENAKLSSVSVPAKSSSISEPTEERILFSKGRPKGSKNAIKRLKGSKKDSKFYCHYSGCEYEGQSAARLDSHIRRNHESNMTFKCTLCDFSTVWNKKYYAHLKAMHFSGPPYVCEICEYTTEKLQVSITIQLCEEIM